MLLLAIIGIAGSIFGITKIPKNSLAYRSIEKSECGMHYDVVTPSLDTYHVSESQIDRVNKRIYVYTPSRMCAVVCLYIFLGVFVFFQLRVWVCDPDDFITDFFYDWREACHRPPSEEFMRHIYTFLGLN